MSYAREYGKFEELRRTSSGALRPVKTVFRMCPDDSTLLQVFCQDDRGERQNVLLTVRDSLDAEKFLAQFRADQFEDPSKFEAAAQPARKPTFADGPFGRPVLVKREPETAG